MGGASGSRDGGRHSTEAQIEEFKRSTSAALRAMADRPEVEVPYGADQPGLTGARARVPQVPRELKSAEVAHVRGECDAIALKLRHHDRKVHQRRLPQGQTARAIYEAVEQARCEAIGARRMAGAPGECSRAHPHPHPRTGIRA